MKKIFFIIFILSTALLFSCSNPLEINEEIDINLESPYDSTVENGTKVSEISDDKSYEGVEIQEEYISWESATVTSFATWEIIENSGSNSESWEN